MLIVGWGLEVSGTVFVVLPAQTRSRQAQRRRRGVATVGTMDLSLATGSTAAVLRLLVVVEFDADVERQSCGCVRPSAIACASVGTGVT